MKLTARENLLLRRALDAATTPTEADAAAKAFIASLRARGINGYDVVAAQGTKTREQTPPAARAESARGPQTPTQEPAPAPVDPGYTRAERRFIGCMYGLIYLAVILLLTLLAEVPSLKFPSTLALVIALLYPPCRLLFRLGRFLLGSVLLAGGQN